MNIFRFGDFGQKFLGFISCIRRINDVNSLIDSSPPLQTAEYGFGAPEIYFGTVLGAPKVHYVIILDSLARPNPPIRFLPLICTVQLSAVYVDL